MADADDTSSPEPETLKVSDEAISPGDGRDSVNPADNT